MISSLLMLGLYLPCAGPVSEAPRAVGDLAELKRDLRDDDAKTRRKAVQELAKVSGAKDEREAWVLVADALADEEPMVADEAQLQFGRATSPVVLEVLNGKAGLASRDSWVALRATEALGRMEMDVDGELLKKGLGAREADLRRTAAWSLERLARGGHLVGDVDRKVRPGLESLLGRDKDPEVRAAALMALEALDQEEGRVADFPEHLSAALGDKRAPLRVAALEVLSRRRPGDAVPAVLRLAAAPEMAVRRAAVDTLAALETPASLVALVQCLKRETELRLRWRAVEHLRRLSGLKHRLDPRPWRRWAEEQKEGWRPAQGAHTSNGALAEEATSSFVGLPVISERVTFLVDFSGSTWQEREGGRTRKDVAAKELRKALESLPETTHFNVIPYTGTPHPWKDELVPATERNVRDALKFFDGCNESGTGNFWDAALLALADENVDTIMALTDGAPTGGHRWNLELMADLLPEANRYRRVAFDALLVDSSRFLRGYWERMCAATGGRTVQVDL